MTAKIQFTATFLIKKKSSFAEKNVPQTSYVKVSSEGIPDQEQIL